MVQVPSASDRAVIFGDFEGFTAPELYDHFLVPELLVRWWPMVATAEATVGGSYVFMWPEQSWTLRGTYTALERGRHLGFTWQWDHDPAGSEPGQVDIYWEELAEGSVTRMAVHHRPFEDSEAGQAARQGIVEGWIHFGMRLAGLRKGDAT